MTSNKHFIVCNCGYPNTIYRSMSGHSPTCPLHEVKILDMFPTKESYESQGKILCGKCHCLMLKNLKKCPVCGNEQ